MTKPDAAFTIFDGHECVAAGGIEIAVDAALAHPATATPLQMFDDRTGAPVDLNLGNGREAAIADYRARSAPDAPDFLQRGRGRPRLGVVPREVTLLPRHWDWLSTQPGGASAALRRLVESAQRAADGPDRARRARDAAYKVMSALAGDLPGFEDASRALFALDHDGLEARLAHWPPGVAAYIRRLLAGS